MVAVALLGVVVAGVVGAVLLARDDAAPARGELIAYGCKEQGNRWYAICVIGVDGAGPTRVTSRLTTTDPAWSPDGRRIAFTRNQEVGEFTTFTGDDVFVMDADGDDVRQLTTHGTGRSTWQPAWSPDGRRIVYVSGNSVATNVPQRWGALFVADEDGSDAQRVTHGRTDTSPAWSPDGREIAFARCERYASSPLPRCAQDLFVVDPAGSALRRLTTSKRLSEVVPAWSPDGSQIAFVTLAPIDAPELQGKEGVYVMNRDGSGVRRVLAQHYLEDVVTSLAWSPSGRTIAFETSPALVCTSISLVDVDDGSVGPLTSCKGPSQTTVSPAWQPDTRAKDR